MRVIIDGKEQSSLSELVDSELWTEIRTIVEHQKKIIQNVKVNGNVLDESTNIPYDEVELIEVETVNIDSLILETYQSAIDYLPRLIDGMNQMVSHFRAGEDGEAVKLFLAAQDGIRWNTQLMDNSSILLPEFQIITNMCLRNRSVLSEMLEALENEDFVTLADLLEYELTPCLMEWFDFIRNYEGVQRNDSNHSI